MICFVRAGPPAAPGRVVTERPSNVVCLPALAPPINLQRLPGQNITPPQTVRHPKAKTPYITSTSTTIIKLPLRCTLHAPALLYLAVYPAGHVPSLRGSHTSPIAPSRPVFRALAWLTSWRCYSSHRRIHRQASGCVTWPTVVVTAAAAIAAQESRITTKATDYPAVQLPIHSLIHSSPPSPAPHPVSDYPDANRLLPLSLFPYR